eukprot:12843441-Alexandrium_andersonii.AAC.1
MCGAAHFPFCGVRCSAHSVKRERLEQHTPTQPSVQDPVARIVSRMPSWMMLRSNQPLAHVQLC